MSDLLQVNWIDDSQAIGVFNDLKLKYTLLALQVSSIDKKRSGQNSARLSSKLDEENVSSLVMGLQHGDSIPFLVVRKITERGVSKYVVAGGNHRLEALIRCGCETLKAYCVECGDTEFLVLCQRLNLGNGKGVSEKDRITYAAAAIASGVAQNQKIAADMFRVGQKKLSDFLRLEQAEQKLIARVGRNVNVPMKVKLALAKIQSDEVHSAALDLARSKGLGSNAVSKVILDAIQSPTVVEQVDAIKKAQMVATCERTIASPHRRVFLSALGTLEKMLQKYSTLQSLDIIDDKSAVLKMVESVYSKLKAIAK